MRLFSSVLATGLVVGVIASPASSLVSGKFIAQNAPNGSGLICQPKVNGKPVLMPGKSEGWAASLVSRQFTVQIPKKSRSLYNAEAATTDVLIYASCDNTYWGIATKLGKNGYRQTIKTTNLPLSLSQEQVSSILIASGKF